MAGGPAASSRKQSGRCKSLPRRLAPISGPRPELSPLVRRLAPPLLEEPREPKRCRRSVNKDSCSRVACWPDRAATTPAPAARESPLYPPAVPLLAGDSPALTRVAPPPP